VLTDAVASQRSHRERAAFAEPNPVPGPTLTTSALTWAMAIWKRTDTEQNRIQLHTPIVSDGNFDHPAGSAG
jgi:hypothetical protein